MSEELEIKCICGCTHPYSEDMQFACPHDIRKWEWDDELEQTLIEVGGPVGDSCTFRDDWR